MNPLIKQNNNKKTYAFFEEPVEEWSTIKDAKGQTILEKFYHNQEKYAFSFQMLAYISRLTVVKNALKNTSAEFKKNPITFSIEGNIGTGKSTLVKNLQDHFKLLNADTLQKETDVIMTERSVHTDCYVFAQMLYDDKKIEDVEYAIYMKWFDEFLQELPPIAFIYIRADPIVSYDRVANRARTGESTIPLTYLENCHRYHEEWLLKKVDEKKLLIIDANEDINANPDLLPKWIKQIEDFVEQQTHL
jgi:deoxyadenosine/deoxycytidine kinase